MMHGSKILSSNSYSILIHLSKHPISSPFLYWNEHVWEVGSVRWRVHVLSASEAKEQCVRIQVFVGCPDYARRDRWELDYLRRRLREKKCICNLKNLFSSSFLFLCSSKMFHKHWIQVSDPHKENMNKCSLYGSDRWWGVVSYINSFCCSLLLGSERHVGISSSFCRDYYRLVFTSPSCTSLHRQTSETDSIPGGVERDRESVWETWGNEEGVVSDRCDKLLGPQRPGSGRLSHHPQLQRKLFGERVNNARSFVSGDHSSSQGRFGVWEHAQGLAIHSHWHQPCRDYHTGYITCVKSWVHRIVASHHKAFPGCGYGVCCCKMEISSSRSGSRQHQL